MTGQAIFFMVTTWAIILLVVGLSLRTLINAKDTKE